MQRNYTIIARPFGNIFREVRYFDNNWTKPNPYGGEWKRFPFTNYDRPREAHYTEDKSLLLSKIEDLKHEYKDFTYELVRI